ncbi:MAG: hypothetical protein IT374_05640 [Polyangiaceae bacterium]|nr:hypothetical protein [Polyangiaceae bacterium]
MRRASLLTILALSSPLSPAACDDGERSGPVAAGFVAPPGHAVRFRPPASGAPRFDDLPFPSDLMRDEAGHVARLDGLLRVVERPEVIQDALASLDGFGRATGAMFFVDVAVDPGSLPTRAAEVTLDDDRVFFVDVDDASPRRGARTPAQARYLPSLGILVVIPPPGVVLPRGTRHAAVVTTKVRAADGVPLAMDAPLAAIAGGARDSAAGRLYGSALDALTATGAVSSLADVAALAVFTTSRMVEELPRLRARLRESTPAPTLLLDPARAAPYTVAVFGALSKPSLDEWLGHATRDDQGREWPGGDDPGGIAHDEICAVVSGAFVAPSFRDPATGRFLRGGDGEIALADASATIPVTLVIPRTPPPPGGTPVVVHGHGLSNDRGSMLSYANELARAGFAVIGVDDVEHGARGGQADVKNNYPGTFVGPDGVPDKQEFPLRFFADFSDFVAVRDNFRQSVLDQTSLVRLVQNPALDLSPLASACGFVPRLSPTRLSWSGGSLGGMMGTMTMAVEPELRAAALQVPGGGFVQLITTGSAKLAPLVSVVAQGSFGIVGDEPLDELHPLALLLGAATEAGDPLGYAPHVTRDPLAGRAPPDVLVTYAVSDEVMPNTATAALVRALGLDVVGGPRAELPGVAAVTAPVQAGPGARVGAAVPYAPANHGLGYVRFDTRDFQPGVPRDEGPRFPKLKKSFKFEQPIREHAAQLVTFLTSADAGAAEIVVTAPPRDDFDGDGVLGSADRDPLDPAVQ